MRERKNNEIRKPLIKTGVQKYAEGSVLIEMGNTAVICSATVDLLNVPPFLKGTGSGWITAEYSMLPRATKERNTRERGKISGRSQEIQRFIGRSLRAGFDLSKMGELTIIVDCDVLNADGGTRTASVNGGFIAVAIAISKLLEREIIKENPFVGLIGAISVGVVNGTLLLDLDSEEDSIAEVDMNVVMRSDHTLVEVQGTGEKGTFSRELLSEMLNLAEAGIKEIFDVQRVVLQKEGVLIWK
jgi:ribonuclease PH